MKQNNDAQSAIAINIPDSNRELWLQLAAEEEKMWQQILNEKDPAKKRMLYGIYSGMICS